MVLNVNSFLVNYSSVLDELINEVKYYDNNILSSNYSLIPSIPKLLIMNHNFNELKLLPNATCQSL